jgi:hypothetical protein
VVDGFEELQAGKEHVVLVSDGVGVFLSKYEESKPKDVRKAIQILVKLATYGLPYMRDTTSFVREGAFPTGGKDGGKAVVYAVKAFQLRIYGGFVTLGGKSCFLALEAAQKKKDKADRAQLERVARALGAKYD